MKKFDSPVHYFCHYAGLEVEDYPAEGECLTNKQFNKAFTNWTTSRDICMRPEVPLAELNDKEVMALFSWQNNNLLKVAYNLHENIYTKEQYFILSDETLIRLNLIEEEAGDIDAIRQHLINSPVATKYNSVGVALLKVDTPDIISKDNADLSKNNTNSLENNFSELEKFYSLTNSRPLKIEEKEEEEEGEEEYLYEKSDEEIAEERDFEEIEEQEALKEYQCHLAEDKYLEGMNSSEEVSINTYLLQAIANGDAEPGSPNFSLRAYLKRQDMVEGLETARELEAMRQQKEAEAEAEATTIDIDSKVDDGFLLEESSNSTKSNWHKGTLSEAIAAPDSVFDEDGLDYLQHIVERVTPNVIYTKETHDFIVDRLHKESSQIRKDCAVFIEFGLLHYFDLDHKEDIAMDEKTFNKVIDYLRGQKFIKKS